MGNKSPKTIDYSVRAPMDPKDPRFVKSFDLNGNPEEIRDFYRSYGFVVFDNIVTEDEIDKSIEDLWNAFPGASRENPATWGRVKHPFGFAGEQPIDGIQLWRNRQHESVYRAFKLAYDLSGGKKVEEALVACLDRGNIMLPTKGPLGKREFESHRLPHFDLNPYIWCGMCEQSEEDRRTMGMYENYFLLLAEGNNTKSHGYPKLRAVLQLSESTEDTGGFECLPGFHRFLRQWCEEHPQKDKVDRSPYGWGVTTNDPIETNMQKITVRAGSIIVFSAELPHSMFPNESEGFRYAQYLRMAPLSTLELSPENFTRRQQMVRQNLPPELEITAIGREVFLLDEPSL